MANHATRWITVVQANDALFNHQQVSYAGEEETTGCVVDMLVRPYKKKILVLRHRRALKIPPDETFLSWEGKKIAAAHQVSHADKI